MFQWFQSAFHYLKKILLVDSDFEMLVAFNGRLSSSSGLYSRQTVSSLSVDTLSIMTVVQLFKWDTLTVLVHSDTSYEILEDTTFSVVMHGKYVVLQTVTPCVYVSVYEAVTEAKKKHLLKRSTLTFLRQ